MVGHPRGASLAGALAAAYIAGARRAGARVELLELAGLEFDPNVRTRVFADQSVEPDLERAAALIAWADHLVFVYPTWWGTMPALLKGFLDRVLAPRFAFEETGSKGYLPLLGGRTAELLTTTDTPNWVWRWIYGAPGDKAMARAILGFCGIEVAQIVRFGPVRGSGAEQRHAWLRIAEAAGARLHAGPFSSAKRARRKLASWLKAIRLQFYPMTWLAYTIGALAAATITGAIDVAAFWWGLLCLFFIEVGAVLANEQFDFETDRLNRNFGPFTGGSRVLATGALSFREVRQGLAAALALALVSALALIAGTGASGASAVPLLVAMTVLALGYTVPPVKLCYRGLGELDVGLTHSTGVIVAGFVFQGGRWSMGLPWLLSLPLVPRRAARHHALGRAGLRRRPCGRQAHARGPGGHPRRLWHRCALHRARGRRRARARAAAGIGTPARRHRLRRAAARGAPAAPARPPGGPGAARRADRSPDGGRPELHPLVRRGAALAPRVEAGGQAALWTSVELGAAAAGSAGLPYRRWKPARTARTTSGSRSRQ